MEQLHLMNPDDSYAERRQLFKNIWETAMNIEDKDNDIMNKPKVLKTLRLEENRCGLHKKKKLKHLRAVCTKILTFCDRLETDDMFYEQVNAEGHGTTQPHPDQKPKKVKKIRTKKKIKKSKSLHSPYRSPNHARGTKSDGKDDFNAELDETSRSTTPIKVKRATRSTGTDKTVQKKGTKSKKRYPMASFPTLQVQIIWP